ncbi:hypothetical protein FSP39_025224 [Pinctada imbricata]|uniref:C2H2-type domain-containing protein n=1 Tax=Pinctada imbricata TaxID=66713 RepID=A0AA89CCB4_PINIB|nr:hypothetical protein FSP39_025224 [Pinctada imbricata]
MYPEDGEMLQDLVMEQITGSLKAQKQIALPDESITLKEIYMQAESWTLKRQILSIITETKSFSEANKMIPNLTQWRYYAAKRHSDDIGCGLPVPQVKIHRNKIDESQLEHFIDFITSSSVIKDLPFGTKTMKLSTGEVVTVPNLIRSLAPTSLITQYISHCEFEGVEPLGNSTLYKILNDCSASVRKSIEGLDYYVAEGGRAFVDLEEILTNLKLPDEGEKVLKKKLIAGKQYLKTDYKVHVERSSNVADHCRNFALGSSDRAFTNHCDHDHTGCCGQCNALDEVLDQISKYVYNSEWENADSIHFKLENAISKVRDWKSHLLRSRTQDEARINTIQNLDGVSVMITCDWAMKFLPRRFREGQTDWFGKRGINWHIAVTFHKSGDDVKCLTHVHIFDSQVSQDAAITSAVLCDVANDVINLLPEIQKIHVFSDNAGCYKNTTTMTTLKETLGSMIHTYNFCEAQDGKGPCDRRASHVKSIIKRYVNEGNDVTSALEMKTAIDSKQNGNFKVKVVEEVVNVEKTSRTQKKIPGISQLHNFEFESDGVRVWQAYGVGEVTDSNADGPQSKKKKMSATLFDCSNVGCQRSFSTSAALDQHLLLGNCLYHYEKTLSDRAKVAYGDRVNAIHVCKEVQVASEVSSGNPTSLQLGWASKQKKKKIVFSDKQTKFMRDQFNVGKTTGRKMDPFIVSQDMRSLKNPDGSFLFTKTEYLTGQQISSFFSRLSMKDKKDVRSAEEEDRLSRLKKEILDDICDD